CGSGSSRSGGARRLPPPGGERKPTGEVACSAVPATAAGFPALLRGRAALRVALRRAALATTLAAGGVAFLAAAARAGLLAAARFLVHRRPGAALGLLVADAAILIAFLDMFGLALLLVGIAALVAAGHGVSPFRERTRKAPREFAQPLIQARSRCCSTVSGTAPGSSTRSWNALRSKAVPWRCSASVRSPMITVWPTL